jgi:hypothetical protein
MGKRCLAATAEVIGPNEDIGYEISALIAP